MLIDAGPDASAMRAALARSGVRHLEALTITHLHDDHIGGAAALAGLVPVSTALVARGAEADAAERLAPLNCPTQEVGTGARLRVGSWSVRVLSPSATVDDPADNASSVVLLASCEGFSAVLTGDAESEVLEPLTRSGALGDVDVLKVGHHGSKGAVSRESLDIMRPELALISVGSANRFGHPAASTVRLLETSGTRVARTDRSGDLTIRVGPDGWRADGLW
jgi:competence protein ComEC